MHQGKKLKAVKSLYFVHFFKLSKEITGTI